MRDRIKSFEINHSNFICLFCFIAYGMLSLAFSIIISFFSSETGFNLWQFMYMVICVGISLGLLWLFGKENILKSQSSSLLKGLIVGGYIIIISVMYLIENVQYGMVELYSIKSIYKIIIFMLILVATAISEEVIFRGIILNIWKEHFKNKFNGLYLSIFLTSLLNGFLYMLDIIAGVSVNSAIYLLFNQFSFAIIISAVYLRTNNIWSVIILNAFYRICGSFFNGFFDTNYNLIIDLNSRGLQNISSLFYWFITNLIVTIFILRKSKRNML